MACVKSLLRFPSQAFNNSKSHHYYDSGYELNTPKVSSLARSYSFSGTDTLPLANNNWFNRNIFSSSLLLDSVQRKLALSYYMLQLLTPITTSSSISDCYSNYTINNLDNSLVAALETTVDSLQDKEMQSLNSSCYPTLVSSESMSVQLPCYPDSLSEERAVCSHFTHSFSEKENRILCTTNRSKKLSVFEEHMKNINTGREKMEPMTSKSSSFDASMVPPSCSSGSVIINDSYIESNEESAKKSSPNCDPLVFDGNHLRDNGSSTQDKNVNVETSVDVCTQGFTLKPINNLAQVLSTPRKNVKKGRPSSKKQKKRKREKSKREKSKFESLPLQTQEVSNTSSVFSEMKQSHPDSENLKFANGLSYKLDNSLHSSRTIPSENNHDKKSTQVNTTSRFCPMAYLLFRLKSSSEEVDDDDSDDADDNDGCSDWSMNEHTTIVISPNDDCNFNNVLTLDSIFKRTNIPESVLDSKENRISESYAKNINQNLRKRLSKSDSYDDSDVEFCASPLSTELTANDFIIHQSGDHLFSSKCCSKINTTADLENAVELIGNYSSADNRSIQISDQEIDFEKINAQWNEHYPTSGFLTCNQQDDAIKDRSIKVHFAVEPHFLTIHVLEEEEERGCPWQQFAIDRERFERRIQELDKIISPVLDADHRVKVLEHRMYQK